MGVGREAGDVRLEEDQQGNKRYGGGNGEGAEGGVLKCSGNRGGRIGSSEGKLWIGILW